MRPKYLSVLTAALFCFLMFSSQSSWASQPQAVLMPPLGSCPDYMDEYVGLVKSGRGYFLTSDGYPVQVGKDGKWSYIISGNSLFTYSRSQNGYVMRMTAYSPEFYESPSVNGLYPSLVGIYVPVKKP